MRSSAGASTCSSGWGRRSIHSHLKMDGSGQVIRPRRPSHAGHRIRIILEAGDVQAAGVDLGVLKVLDRDGEMDVVALLGPDLLTTGSHRGGQPGRRPGSRPIADALLDQQVMVPYTALLCPSLMPRSRGCLARSGHTPNGITSSSSSPSSA